MQSQPEAIPPVDGAPPADGAQPLAWAPIEPAPKKKRLGLWIGLGVGALLLAAGGASAILIAPGTTVAGIHVGWAHPGCGAPTSSARTSPTRVSRSRAPARESRSPGPTSAPLSTPAPPPTRRSRRTRCGTSAPGWASPSPPRSPSIRRRPTPPCARPSRRASRTRPMPVWRSTRRRGSTRSLPARRARASISPTRRGRRFTTAIAEGGTSLEYSGDPAEALPAVSDDDATTTATALNTMLGQIGFYVGEERTVPIDAATAASWIEVVNDDGQLRIQANADAIQPTVDALAPVINREPTSATNIVDSAARALREETARRERPHPRRHLHRRRGLRLSARGRRGRLRARRDRGAVPDRQPRAPHRDRHQRAARLADRERQRRALLPGVDGPSRTPTPTGNFKVFAHTRMQDMVGQDYVTGGRAVGHVVLPRTSASTERPTGSATTDPADEPRLREPVGSTPAKRVYDWSRGRPRGAGALLARRAS